MRQGNGATENYDLDDRSIFLEKRVKKHLTNDFKNVNIILVLEKKKMNLVIIAKRIHLFPFRTQKLSS